MRACACVYGESYGSRIIPKNVIVCNRYLTKQEDKPELYLDVIYVLIEVRSLLPI